MHACMKAGTTQYSSLWLELCLRCCVPLTTAMQCGLCGSLMFVRRTRYALWGNWETRQRAAPNGFSGHIPWPDWQRSICYFRSKECLGLGGALMASFRMTSCSCTLVADGSCHGRFTHSWNHMSD